MVVIVLTTNEVGVILAGNNITPINELPLEYLKICMLDPDSIDG